MPEQKANGNIEANMNKIRSCHEKGFNLVKLLKKGNVGPVMSACDHLSEHSILSDPTVVGGFGIFWWKRMTSSNKNNHLVQSTFAILYFKRRQLEAINVIACSQCSKNLSSRMDRR